MAEQKTAETAEIGELKAFKDHVELYEFLVEKIKARVTESIMPAINLVKTESANVRFDFEIMKQDMELHRRLDRLHGSIRSSSSSYSEKAYESEGIDVVSIIFWGTLLGLLAYGFYTSDLFQDLK